MSGEAEHWEAVWAASGAPEKSWYQDRPDRSLELIRRTGLPPTAGVVDVGGGASTLVDHLVADGWSDLTVVDVAAAALEEARRRLPEAPVAWVVADLLTWRPGRTFDLWHDRALFHFLCEPEDRERYRTVLADGLAPGGFAIVATFAPDGPERCSGLPTVGYGPEELAAELQPVLVPLDVVAEVHHTPAGAAQSFLYGLFRRP